MIINVKYIDTVPQEIWVKVLPSEFPMFGDFDPDYTDNFERAQQMEALHED